MTGPTPDRPPAPGGRGPGPWARPSRGILLAGAIVAADLATKAAVAANVGLGASHELLPFLNLVHVKNSGAAFGLLAGMGEWARWFLVGVSVALVALLGALAVRGRVAPLERLALWVVIGGALGNLHDRVRHGTVVDFIDVHAAGWHWPAFNVADSAICVGLALYVLAAFLVPRDRMPG